MIGGGANIGTRADQARFGSISRLARVTRLGISSIAALALAAALVGAPVAGAAKPQVQPAQRFVYFNARGSHGWRLQVTAIAASGRKARQPIGFFTRGPHHEEVQYVGAEGQATEDGVIEAKAPGLGRVAVRFEQTYETPVTFIPESGCKAEGKSASLKGVFRGTIKFHGEGGYTTVDRGRAPGHIEVVPREVCHQPKHHPQPPKETGGEAGIEYLSAGRDEGGGSLTFDAFATGLKIPREGPLTSFSASYTHKRGKLLIVASTRVLGKEKGLLSLTAPDGMPTEATVKPPAPFTGSANFKLESPTTASWTGDLSVEVPTLGTVDLTEPGFWAGACGPKCTKTFPEGLRIGFFTASPLALDRTK